ncbi:MAG TPA: hypothetical protein VIG79_19535 [Lapillicoccus sp.]|uniref:hypothetical protein n=1 Tax=Lapillicoccus sp. TaxID=1909287 RepID=UPI002F950D22
MVSWLTVVVLVAAAALGVLALVYALTRRGVDDRLLLVLGALEIALLAQVFVGLGQGIGRTTEFEKAVFFAYLLTVPFIAPVAVFLSLKEKTRSSMLVVLGSAVVVGVLVARLLQIWGAGV